jgi:Na+/melibiose symporter-like transporter
VLATSGFRRSLAAVAFLISLLVTPVVAAILRAPLKSGIGVPMAVAGCVLAVIGAAALIATRRDQ